MSTDNILESEEVASTDKKQYQSLDPRSISLERLSTAISFAVLCAIGLGVGLPVLLTAPFPAQVIVPAVWIVLLVWAAFQIFCWPPLNYRYWKYHVGRELVEIQRGVIWRTTISIPINRLQHIDLNQGPLQRRYHLTSLELHTAGTEDSTQKIDGLDEQVATRLRDQLVSAAAKRREKHQLVNENSEPLASSPSEQHPNQAASHAPSPEMGSHD